MNKPPWPRLKEVLPDVYYKSTLEKIQYYEKTLKGMEEDAANGVHPLHDGEKKAFESLLAQANEQIRALQGGRDD